MSNPFFDHPILNSPYEPPSRHWDLGPAHGPEAACDLQVDDMEHPFCGTGYMEPDGAAIHPHSTFVEVGHLFTRDFFFIHFFPYGCPMIIRITRTTGLSQIILNKVVAILRQHTGPLKFEMELEELEFNGDYFEWENFFGQCTEYRQKHNLPVDDFLIVLTELNDKNNFFSTFSPQKEDRTVFIHAMGWENYIHSEPENPIAYQVIENILHSLCFQYHGEHFYNAFHDTPIGCMNDMCGWKPDISFKLRTGDICPDCMSILESAPVSKEIISQCLAVIESVRLNMLFNKDLHTAKTFEMHLPFPVAITKRKLSTTVEPLAKTLMLLDHFDSLIRTSFLMFGKLTYDENSFKEFLRQNRLSELPSLGILFYNLRVLSREKERLYSDCLPDGFEATIKEVCEIENAAEIIKFRNDVRGHSYYYRNAGYGSEKAKIYLLIDAVDKIEKLLEPFFNSFYYYYVMDCRRTHGRTFTIRVNELCGSNIAFIEKVITYEFFDAVDLPIDRGLYMVHRSTKKWIEISPYISYRTCAECRHIRVLVYDGKYLLDPFIGHRFERQQP